MTAGAAPPPELTLSFDYQSPFASLQRPQYRLRVEDIRIFYDVTDTVVEVLVIAPTSRAAA